MNKKVINLTFAAALLTTSLFLTDCSKNTESDAAKINNTNQSPVSNKDNSVNAPSVPPSNITSGTPPTAVTGTPPATINNNSGAPIAANQKSPAVKAPTPVIGGGGEDLLLFTQVRGALDADQGLAYVIIEIKEGNVTLSGNVANNDLKAKAEKIARTVKGVKGVKNSLQVS